jgi:hypothetical protein
MTIIFHDSCTSRFPRSLKEAFDEERFPVIERQVTARGHRVVLWLSVVGFVVVALLLLSGVM